MQLKFYSNVDSLRLIKSNSLLITYAVIENTGWTFNNSGERASEE